MYCTLYNGYSLSLINNAPTRSPKKLDADDCGTISERILFIIIIIINNNNSNGKLQR